MAARKPVTFRVTRGLSKILNPQDVEDLLDNKPLDCVHCGNPWPTTSGDKVPRTHYAVRIDPDLYDRVKKLRNASTFLRAIVEKAFGICPLCGRVRSEEGKYKETPSI